MAAVQSRVGNKSDFEKAVDKVIRRLGPEVIKVGTALTRIGQRIR